MHRESGMSYYSARRQVQEDKTYEFVSIVRQRGPCAPFFDARDVIIEHIDRVS